MRSRPSCQDTRSSCSRAQKRHRPWIRLKLEPRRIDAKSDRPSSGHAANTGRAIVIEPHVRARMPGRDGARDATAVRSPAAKLDEAVGLARAIDLEVVDTGIVTV